MSDPKNLANALRPATTPAPEPEPTPPPAAAIDAPDARVDYVRESYAWAEDVFFVYEHLGDTATKAKNFPPARRALFNFAKKNMDQFLGQLLPKAMQLLEKSRDKHGDDDIVVREEKKGIAELRRILAAAIVEAAGVQ